MIISWLLYILFGLLPSLFFDVLTGHTQVTLGFWEILVLFVSSELVRILDEFAWSVVKAISEYTTRALLQHNLLQYILEKPSIHINSYAPGETLNRFRDDIQAVTDLLTSWLFLVSSCIFAIIAIVIMIQISFFLTILTFR